MTQKNLQLWAVKPNEFVQVYFGLNLSQRLYTNTGNLSKTLQQEKLSAVRGKEFADLTVQILENMRNEHGFRLLYKEIKVSASEIETVSPPALPRKQIKPNYSILHYVTGNPELTVEHIIRKICMNVTNLFVTKLSILLLTLSWIKLINQHLNCLLKQSSCF